MFSIVRTEVEVSEIRDELKETASGASCDEMEQLVSASEEDELTEIMEEAEEVKVDDSKRLIEVIEVL